MTELAVRRLREEAVLPERAYPGDAGLDLVACERLVIEPGERAVVGTGIAVAIPEGHAGLVVPRSGLAVDCCGVLPRLRRSSWLARCSSSRPLHRPRPPVATR